MSETPLLDLINAPADLRRLEERSLKQLADELRRDSIDDLSVIV
jgi:1-deoxy-D-xylulose-5-phosphate synthase